MAAGARNCAGCEAARNFPVWLAKVFAGDVGVMLGTEACGASNVKAKRELGWTPLPELAAGVCGGNATSTQPDAEPALSTRAA